MCSFLVEVCYLNKREKELARMVILTTRCSSLRSHGGWLSLSLHQRSSYLTSDRIGVAGDEFNQSEEKKSLRQFMRSMDLLDKIISEELNWSKSATPE